MQAIRRIHGDRYQLGVSRARAGDYIAANPAGAPSYQKQIWARSEIFEKQLAIPGIRAERGLFNLQDAIQIASLDGPHFD